MAQECQAVIGAMNLVLGKHLDRLVIYQLHHARNQLESVAAFLEKLEEVQPENMISTKLGALFRQARDGFSEISTHMDQRYAVRMMISKALKIIKLENIAELKAASKPSRSTDISEVLKILKPENIVERIKDSKTSTSSSRITLEMVWLVEFLLDYVLGRSPFYSQTDLKKLRHLQVYFILTENWCIEHESLKDFFTLVEDVAYTALQLRFLALLDYMDKDENQYRVLNCEFSKLLERISSFRTDLRQIYKSVLLTAKPSSSETTMTSRCMLDFVHDLQEDLKEHLGHGRIWWLEQGLCDLSKFLYDIKYPWNQLKEFSSLQSLVEALVIEAAFVIYSYDKDRLFLLHPKFNHFNVEVDLIKILNLNATRSIIPLKDLIDYALGEVIFMRTFLMVSLEQCKQQTKITDFLTLIQSVTDQARSDIQFLCHHGKREDMATLHFQLLLKFKFIKAAIGQMCPTISASSALDHSTINLLNFLPINFDVIDSFFSMLKSSKTSSSVCLKMDMYLMRFHEYILDNLPLKDETGLSFTIADEVKIFYYGLLLQVTYLVDPLVQCHGWEKQNNLSTGFGTTAIAAESAISLSDEDNVDSNKSRKVNLVLQFLTVAFKLIESEGILMDLLKYKATLEAYIVDLIETAHEELIYLRALLIDVLRQHTELNELYDVLMHAEVTANKFAQISGYCYGSFMEGRSIEKIGILLSDLRQEIESVKVEVRKVCFKYLDASPYSMIDGEGLIDFLLKHQDGLLNYDACSIPFLKNQIQVVKDKLVYLGSFLADIVQHRDMHQELKDLVERVRDIKFVCLFPVRNKTPAWYYMLYLSDVKQFLKFVEAEVKMICLKVPDTSSYSFPKINELGFLDCFLGKVDEMLSSKLDSVIDLKLQIGSIKEGLLCLRTLIDHFPEIYDEHDEAYSLITRVTAMAYKAEYVMDSCLTCSYPLWFKVLWISEAVENIKLVNEVVRETCERKKIDLTVHRVKKTSTYLVPSLSANTPGTNEETEGFQEAMDQIKNQLLGGSPQLDVISLVGMPGIGKTTLAEKIYNDPVITSRFDVRAQCRLTQVYSWRELLVNILNGVLEPADRNEKDGELADELRRFLLTKRFLILIDDVWDEKVWDNLHLCFKDSRNRCRIILTTHLSNVANYAKCESEPHHLRLFKDDESWTLLQEELFQGESGT